MASVSRETSRDRAVKHQHSFSESSRLSIVPMWDSSDPERAPPPLPLNPGKDGSNTSPVRASASGNVAAAARALVERARENMNAAYTTNQSPERSPDRSILRTPQHKRLQSLQHDGLRDIRASVETPTENNSRASTPSLINHSFPSTSPESSRSRSATPTPSGRDLRSRPIIEGTPPSATVLALQNMQLKDSGPLGDITNGATAPKLSHNVDHLYNQIQNITAIANHLQQEMAALSRRSKDNATDLISLKEATNMRDEDIRKALRELVNNVRNRDTLLSPPPMEGSRSSSAMGPAYLYGSPTFAKSVQFLNDEGDHERGRSPAPHSIDSTASVTMLEKIVRDMATKDSHDKLSSSLTHLLEKSSNLSKETTRKLEDLVERLREKEEHLALVKHTGSRRRSSVIESPTQDNMRASRNVVLHTGGKTNTADNATSGTAPQAHAFVSEEMRQLLQRIKDGIHQSGGMTSEVKSLVRELRGEVLGMGRELGRKLEQQSGQSGHMVPYDKVKLEQIVQDGLADLREQMESVIQTRRRESAGSAMSRNTVDSLEVAEAVKHALAQYDIQVGGSRSSASKDKGMDRESILSAVREAYEAYKPEIELQQFGLERDEILQCLKEGLEEYQTNRSFNESSSITREEILETIHGAIQQFQPPAPANDATEIKEEVMAAVRESLERFSPPPVADTARGWKPGDVTRGDLMDAVRDGLGEHKKSGAREIEINSEDLFEAVRAGLETTHVPYGQQVIDSLREIIDGMKVEFQQYSAANGRDTEQVLDAVRDGLESLRGEIESYVDRAQDVTGKDEIIDTLKSGFVSLQDNMQSLVESRSPTLSPGSGNQDLLGYIKTEFESLHDVIGSQLETHGAGSGHKEDIIKAIVAGFAQMNNAGTSRGLDEPSDELLDAFKAEFEQLQSNLQHGSASHKDEILESLQDSISVLHSRISGSEVGTNSHELLNAMRDEFAALRESLQSPVLYSGSTRSATGDETAQAIKSTMEDIRVQLSADQSEASKEALGHIREELENLRAAIGGSLMLSSGGQDKEELVDAVRSALEDVNGSPSSGRFESIREELEQLRHSLTSSLVHASPSANADVVDTLNNNLDNLRNDISKMVDKPVDMTVSYEILDTLKSGLGEMRSDLDQLKAHSVDQVVLAGQAASTAPSHASNLDKGDIERLEVMLAQLQIKVEAMDQNIQSTPQPEPRADRDVENSATKDDVASIESILRDMHIAINAFGARETPHHESNVTKEDTDAIETLLQNTKAKIDDHVLPALDGVVKLDQIETLETLVKLTQENVDTLLNRYDGSSASKEDVAAIAHMVDEASTTLNEIKRNSASAKEVDAVSKADIDLVGVMCMEIKNKLIDMSEDGSVPTKADIGYLNVLLTEFRESHEKLRERYEGDIEVTARAFDDRKEESAQILERIDVLKSSLDDANEEMRQRIKKGNSDVRAIDEILVGIEERIDGAPNSILQVHELTELVKAELGKTHNSLDTIRAEQGDQATSILDKSAEYKSAIVSEVVAKLEEHFKHVSTHHDLQQQATEAAAKAVTDRAAQQEDLLNCNKAVAEDLKVSIDTLGATVTGIEPALKEATDKMGDDAKTVFSRVDEVQARLEETYLDSKSEHQLTREEMVKSLAVIDDLRSEIASQHPESIGALKALLVIAEQHFELSRNFKETMEGSSDTLKAHFAEEIKRLPVPQIEGAPPIQQYDDAAIHAKLDQVLARGVSVAYDDARVHDKLDDILKRDNSDKDSKLDELIGHLKTTIQGERLDAIHAHVMSTAAEVQALVAFQTRLLESRHESREKEAQEAELSLNRSRSEKDSLEADIAALKQNKQALAADVDKLKSQREQAMTQKMKLSAEVSSLETALAIRREELHEMDARADALERRIIDGVMDHSRALLLTKSNPKPVNMSLKRVTSNNSSASVATTTPTMVNSYVNMTLGKPNPNVYRSKTSATPSSRRIASLNQISNKSPGGGKGLAPLPKAVNGGLSNLKRSQSVRNQALRKTSWAPGSGSMGGFDKENDVVSEDSEAEQEAEAEYEMHRSVSQADSRVINDSRRTSITGSSEYTYGTGSDYTYGTGSYVTGSDLDRRSSIGSTIRSSLRPSSSLEPAIHEQSEQDQKPRDSSREDSRRESLESIVHSDTGSVQRVDEEAPSEWTGEQAMVLANEKFELPHIRTDGYDSGLGSDLPTATGLSALEGSNRDYFNPANEYSG